MRVKILAITRHNNRFRIGVATTEIIPYDSENLDNKKQKYFRLKLFAVINFSDPFGRNRGRLIIIWNGLNIKIDIVQKVYK